MEAYKKRVLSLSGGVPTKIDRLVRFVAVKNIVRNRDVEPVLLRTWPNVRSAASRWLL